MLLVLAVMAKFTEGEGLKDRVGQRFGKLLVARFHGRVKTERGSTILWECQCDCGKLRILASGNLAPARSCGCTPRKGFHGGSTTRTFSVWTDMHRRCLPSYKQAKDYFGRGIKVCARWNSFPNFLADMGEAPSGLTLDRTKNDGIYEPGNCRWATRQVQNQNTRKNVFVIVEGQRMLLSDAMRKTGINQYRLRRYHSKNVPASYF
jgi:hypothetical protein